jgi:hypothetical protein
MILIECPVCDWRAALFHRDLSRAQALRESHIDSHCNAFAKELDLTL